MKIAIIGSGISGLYAAWKLSKHHQVTIFEKNTYFGGHTDTHD
ncbi:FAD-dependent oxidoreductase, partial [Acinetobacter bereziniae]